MGKSEKENQVFRKILESMDITIIKTWDDKFKALKGREPTKQVIGEWDSMTEAVNVLKGYVR